jgi:LGFP repeat-containing protein
MKTYAAFFGLVVSLVVVLWLQGCSGCAANNPNVVTQHNNEARWGQTLAEKHLRPGNVNASNFGLLYERNVNGAIYAQPLYVHGVHTANSGTKNLLFIASETNWVYAFDADDVTPFPNAGVVYSRQLQPTGAANICGETPSHVVGITSTPVIDTDAGTMYVVARNANNHQYYLHALDIKNNLNDKFSPVQIGGTDPNGITFNAECERNRPGLLLQNGVVYIGFATFSCDAGCPNNVPYHGWVFGYSASNLSRVGIFCTSPESGGAGVWESGNGLLGAGSSIYFETGNGPGPLGDAFVMLSTTSSPPGLQLAHSSQPSDAAQLNNGDTDLGSGGPMFLPPGFIIGGGKQGRYYVLDSGTMALTQDPDPTPPGNFDGFQAFTDTYHSNPASPPCASLPPAAGCDRWSVPGCYIDPQRYQNGEQCGPNIHAGPVFWSTANPQYGLIYQLPEKDYLKSFRYDKNTHHVDETPFRTSGVRTIEGMPGGFSSLSVNFDHDAILWVSYPLGDGQWNNVPGRLAAFDGFTLQQLWSHDGGYLFAKFVPPTIADGKVIRATASNKVVVYGLLSTSWWSRLMQAITQLLRIRKPIPPPPPPPHDRGAIEAKFQLAGGANGLLHTVVGEPRALDDDRSGWYQDFRGLVFGLPSPTVSVKPAPGLTMPTCSQADPGAGTPFDASIYWSTRTGAHIVSGEIREAWLKLGGPRSSLGYPVSDEAPTADGTGRFSQFEHGLISWAPAQGVSLQKQQRGGPAR